MTPVDKTQELRLATSIGFYTSRKTLKHAPNINTVQLIAGRDIGVELNATENYN